MCYKILIPGARRMKKTFLNIVLLFFILMCLTASNIACSKQVAQLPVLETGNKWVYNMVVDDIEYDVTIEVTGEDITDGKNCYVMKWHFEPEFHDVYEGILMKVDKDTNFPVEAQWTGKSLGMPFTIVIRYDFEFPESPWWPLEDGKELKVIEIQDITTGSAGIQQTTTYEQVSIYKVVKVEDITIAAGTLSCFKIVEYDESQRKLSETWYSDQVANDVKALFYEQDMILELKSYSR